MISGRTGLGLIEQAVLQALYDIGATPERPHRKSANIVGNLYETAGIGPRVGYETLCSLAAPWLMHRPLVDFHGNLGGLESTPANPRYTEVRLSRAGALAAAADRGDGPRVPVGLIDGDLSGGGGSPPFAPRRVVEAIERAAGDPAVSNAELVDLLGTPSFPTGCDVVADMSALAAGEPTELHLSARVEIESSDGAARVVISHLPFGVGPDAIGAAIASRAGRGNERVRADHPRLHARMTIPIVALSDESSSDAATRIVCTLAPDADGASCRDRILETWPVTVVVPVRLRAPAAEIVRSYADDPARQGPALRALLDETL